MERLACKGLQKLMMTFVFRHGVREYDGSLCGFQKVATELDCSHDSDRTLRASNAQLPLHVPLLS
jgi:hypothetical protein